MAKKMDGFLVAQKENHESELKYISSKYKVPIKVVRKVCKEQGRSRKKVYAALRVLGYVIKTKRFSLPF